jgi:two-component sensor histidine kinase
MFIRSVRMILPLLLVALTASVVVPLASAYYVLPRIHDEIVNEIEMDAERVTHHLIVMMGLEASEIASSGVNAGMINGVMEDFGLLKVRLFDASGTVVYSTEPAEEGTLNGNVYFREQVARGQRYTKVIEREGGRSMEGEPQPGAVVEVYVPVMRGNLFAGAVEVYYDMSARAERIHSHMDRITWVYGLASLMMFGAVVLSVRKSRSTVERTLHVEQALREAHADMDALVRERTAELEGANERLTREVVVRAEAEDWLRDLLGEREVLMKEIHHRVKNNLQVVTSLLGMQARQTDRGEELFRETENRIRAMALVHESLYHSLDLTYIDFKAYLDSLGTYLVRAYKANSSRVRLVNRAEPVKLTIEQAVPLGLLTTELVGNALRHAFPHGRSGTITLRLFADASDQCCLSVEDDGVGYTPPEGMERGHTAGKGQSLGLTVIRSLVAQLDGSAEYGPGPGTAVTVRFNLSGHQPVSGPGPERT